jgi:hypothetical protein
MRVSTAVVILSLAASVAPSVALPLPAMTYASLLLHLQFSSFILLCRSRGATFSLYSHSPPPLPQFMPKLLPPPQHPGLKYPSPNPPSFVHQPWPPLQYPRPTYPNLPSFVYQPLPPSAHPFTPSSTPHTPPSTDHTPSSTSHTPPNTYHTPPDMPHTPPSTYHTPLDTPRTPPDIPPSQYQSSSPLSLERELLERVDQRIKLAARAYVRELLTVPMNNLD